jgi:ABC-type uncharacterized transport system ATPase subunit
VLSGELSRLRASAPQRFVEIHYRGTAADWSTVPSVEVVGGNDGHVTLRVAEDADLAAVMRAAQEHGDLVSFSFEPPALSDLFREAVGA